MKSSLIIVLVASMIVPAFAATPFTDYYGLTQNGIEWCEENRALYGFMGDSFFEHHQHSIESRICASLYNDPLWTYSEPDRYEVLKDRSHYYLQLEINESAEEAESGKIDPTPAGVEEEVQEIAAQEEIREELEQEKEDIVQNDVTVNDVSVNDVNTNDGNDNGCLIATATYGSELAPQVQQLREIRDNSLLQTQSGTTFMTSFNQFYYAFSPTIADWERQNPAFKEAVKITITPLISSLAILNYVDIDSEAEMLGYGIGVIAMNIGMYFVAPAIVIQKIATRVQK